MRQIFPGALAAVKTPSECLRQRWPTLPVHHGIPTDGVMLVLFVERCLGQNKYARSAVDLQSLRYDRHVRI